MAARVVDTEAVVIRLLQAGWVGVMLVSGGGTWRYFWPMEAGGWSP